MVGAIDRECEFVVQQSEIKNKHIRSAEPSDHVQNESNESKPDHSKTAERRAKQN
jgi:hypothetical protein